MKFILMAAAVALVLSNNASAAKTMDLVTRASEMKCSGDGHNVEIGWDTAIMPLGPTKVLVDGKELPSNMMMGWEKDATSFSNPAAGFGFKINHKKAQKVKKFKEEVVVGGKPYQMECAYKTGLKFLRVRDKESWETPSAPDPKREPIEQGELPPAPAAPSAPPANQESGDTL